MEAGAQDITTGPTGDPDIQAPVAEAVENSIMTHQPTH